MSNKLRILVGPEQRLRIVKLLKCTVSDGNMHIETDGGNFYRSLKYFPTDKKGWVEKIEINRTEAARLKELEIAMGLPPTRRFNKKTWLLPQPNFAIMKPRSAHVVSAAWNHVNYAASFPFDYEDAINGGIVFG